MSNFVASQEAVGDREEVGEIAREPQDNTNSGKSILPLCNCPRLSH